MTEAFSRHGEAGIVKGGRLLFGLLGLEESFLIFNVESFFFFLQLTIPTTSSEFNLWYSP
eukprot:m.167304 g.167304  ORF g.167304 m.167304 type:complete len:60 (-) comp15245_c0_seq24:1630-1809(-)